MIKRNNTQEMIEIIQAYQEGKDIEVSDDGENPKWILLDREDVTFNFGNNTYRVAPKFTFPLYAKSRNNSCVVKFVEETEGYVIEKGSSYFKIGDYEQMFKSCFRQDTWEILSDYKEVEYVEYFEVIRVGCGGYHVFGTLYTEEELKKYPEYVKTGRSFMLKKL